MVSVIFEDSHEDIATVQLF